MSLLWAAHLLNPLQGKISEIDIPGDQRVVVVDVCVGYSSQNCAVSFGRGSASRSASTILAPPETNPEEPRLTRRRWIQCQHLGPVSFACLCAVGTFCGQR